MDATALLSTLSERGLTVIVAGDMIEVRPRTRLNDDLRARIRERKPELLAALMRAANDEPQYRWRLTLPDGAQLKVCAVPELTLSDMQLRYPATIIEPAPSIPRRQPTAEESAELAALIAVVYGNDTEEERAEALTLALADPSSALICYRFIARERAAVVRGQVENRTGQVENRTEHDQNC